jgi:hypothetical protein
MRAAGSCFFIVNRSIFLIAAHGAPGLAEIDPPCLKLAAARLGQTMFFKDIPRQPNLDGRAQRI